MIAINGMGSRIAQELTPLLPTDEAVQPYDLSRPAPWADRFVFCQGHLAGRTLRDHDHESTYQTFDANFMHVAAACDRILAANDHARIVVIGSESGNVGSYDMAYAGAKAALHLYVQTKGLKPDQQLACVAPGIIADAGMTTRRQDAEALADRARAHPKRRFCTALEVARLIHFLLYVDEGYISGVTIRMNGGEHAWR